MAQEGAPRGASDFLASLRRAEPPTALVFHTPRQKLLLPEPSPVQTVSSAGQRCGLVSHHLRGLI